MAVGEEQRQPGLFVSGHRLRQQAGHQVCQRARRRHRGEQTKHQKQTRGDLTDRGDVGQDVGVLEAHRGQRIAPTVQAGAAQQTECLLQSVPDQDRADAETQDEKTEVLGAPTVCSVALGVDIRSVSRPVPLRMSVMACRPPGWT